MQFPISNLSVRTRQYLLTGCIALLGMTACKKDPEVQPETNNQGIRPKVDYALLTPSTPYKTFFTNEAGDTVADLSVGNTRYRMFQALNYYLGSAVRDSKTLDSVVMKNMFANSGNPFSDVTSLNIKGSDLNGSGIGLRDITAITSASAEAERRRLDLLFGEMARLSAYFADTAAAGKPGKAGNYLADARGIEVAQIIQKSLIGALQLDYISNHLLSKGLDADNKTILTGKKYTQLEQNWDEAYGFLTLNPIYLQGYTDATKGVAESFLGSYVWEYNKGAYSKMFPAFLRGRAAIANNDIAEVRTQANFIRTQMEKAIASAAVGYLNKWKTGTTDAARIHAMGEGLGFIYSLRFCKINGADVIFSDTILANLIGSSGGYWDLTNTKINEAAAAITAKFNL